MTTRRRRPTRVTYLAALASLALVAAVGTPAARAADSGGGGAAATVGRRDSGARLEMFRKSLDDLKLSDEQKTKLDAIFEKAKGDLQKTGDGDGGRPDREAIRQRVEAFRDLRTKVMDVLTPDQRRQFEEKLQTLRPGGGGGEGAGMGGGQGLQRVRANLEKLDLTADQKQAIEKITADTREKARQVIADANGDREGARKQMGEVFRDALREIGETLTPEQQKKFRDLMEQAAAEGPRRPAAASGEDDKMMAGGEDKTMAGGGEDMMMAEGGGSAKGRKAKKAAAAASAKPAAAPKAPVDLASVKFTRLDGRTVPISAYKGRPLVLVFGSYSCPTFREHAKELEELQRHYGTRANFLLVYTREAHPVGGWEVQRNKDAEISVQPAKDEAARVAAAKQARATLGLSIPTAVDTMDDELATAFDAFPNGAVILDREGKVAARQKWAQPRGLRILLDNLYNTPTATAASVTKD